MCIRDSISGVRFDELPGLRRREPLLLGLVFVNEDHELRHDALLYRMTIGRPDHRHPAKRNSLVEIPGRRSSRSRSTHATKEKIMQNQSFTTAILVNKSP